MTTKKLQLNTFLFSLIFLLFFNFSAHAGNGITLYTPYTNISVPPGESIDYTLDVKNYGSQLNHVDIALSGLPKEWSYSLKAGGYTIKRISVLPGEKKTLSLKINVPSKVDKGTYKIRVIAKNYDVLPLIIDVSEQGTFKTEFTSDQINMEGHAKSNFSFTTKLKNHTGEKQTYSLRVNMPRGWNVIFKPNYKQATAVEIEPGNTANISIEVKPPYGIKAGTYKIPVQAVNKYSTANLELEVVIKGSYDLELTTPTGLLSSSVTSGREKKIEFVVKNSGSSRLSDITFNSSKPKNWEISIQPDTIPALELVLQHRFMQP